MERLIIALVSLLLALIFAFPTVVIIVGVFLAYYAEWISLAFCLIFTWNIAKFVESKYIEYLGKQ